MASFTFKGMEEYEKKISLLYKDTRNVCRKAVYAGAKVVADAVKENMEALPAKPELEGIVAYAKKDPAPLTVGQKQGLIKGFGISPLEVKDGYINAKLGFSGYNNAKTKKYPKGQPNVLVARGIESGTSDREKHPFVRPALNKSKKPAVEAMKQAVDEDIEQKLKGR